MSFQIWASLSSPPRLSPTFPATNSPKPPLLCALMRRWAQQGTQELAGIWGKREPSCACSGSSRSTCRLSDEFPQHNLNPAKQPLAQLRMLGERKRSSSLCETPALTITVQCLPRHGSGNSLTRWLQHNITFQKPGLHLFSISPDNRNKMHTPKHQ